MVGMSSGTFAMFFCLSASAARAAASSRGFKFSRGRSPLADDILSIYVLIDAINGARQSRRQKLKNTFASGAFSMFRLYLARLNELCSRPNHFTLAASACTRVYNPAGC